MATIYSLFPTAVSAYHVDILNEEIQFISSLEIRANQGNYSSVNTRVLDLPELKRLHMLITEAAQEYINMIYKPRYPVKVYLTQSWTNHTKAGGYHHLHRHDNSLISGVIYIAAGRNNDAIHFFNPTRNNLTIDTDSDAPFNAGRTRIQVGRGDLIIFPSWLWHQVDPIQNDRPDTRISIAFNTYAKGDFGDDFSLTRLIL